MSLDPNDPRWAAPADLTDDQLIVRLTERYAPSVIPPCRVCGEPLRMCGSGGGPTVWGCSGQEDDPDRPGWLRYKPGRRCADEHYMRSRFEDRRRGGDDDVIKLIGRFRKLAS